MTADLLTLSRKTETDAMHWMLLQAFMNQNDVEAWRRGNTVLISFDGATTAEQFHKLLLNARGRKP